MALTEIYVDPALNSDTGTGTIGDPYGDLEFAIESETFDTTNGTRVNIKAGTAEVLAANLATAFNDTVTTPAWAPTRAAPCVIQGYTAVAGDGGVGRINCDSNTFFTDAAIDYVLVSYMDIHTVGANKLADVDNWWAFYRCELSGGSNGCLLGDQGLLVMECYVHSFTGGNAMQGSTDSMYFNNYVDARGADLGIAGVGSSNVAEGNIVICDGAADGIVIASACVCRHNSVWSDGGTGQGIRDNAAYNGMVCENNIVVGFSGVGGVGIELDNADSFTSRVQGNAVYDCTTAYDISTDQEPFEDIFGGDNETLTASPFTDAANGDFSPVLTVGNIKEGALPNQIGGGLV